MAISDRTFKIFLIDKEIMDADMAIFEMVFDQTCEEDESETLRFMHLVKERKTQALKRLAISPLTVTKALLGRKLRPALTLIKEDVKLLRTSSKDLFNLKVLAILNKEEAK